MVFEQIQVDLEAESYEVWPVVLPACGVNAPHKRDRVWFVARRTADDPLNCGHRNNGEPDKGQDSLQGERRSTLCAGVSDGTDTGTSSNPSITGREERIESNGQTDSEESGTRLDNRPERSGNEWDVTDPDQLNGDLSRLRASEIPQQQEAGILGDNVANSDLSGCQTERKQSKSTTQNTRTFDMCGGWERFPTVSPVCGRNDGVSLGLSGITFSKWRNEGIKGLGNSWVPQVVYQIFKSINDYEQLQQDTIK